jgi:hypothetical protein
MLVSAKLNERGRRSRPGDNLSSTRFGKHRLSVQEVRSGAVIVIRATGGSDVRKLERLARSLRGEEIALPRRIATGQEPAAPAMRDDVSPRTRAAILKLERVDVDAVATYES